MFSSIRVGAPVYVLHKQEPRIEIGEVVTVGTPVPQFGTTTYAAGLLQPQKMVVDLKIKVGEQTIDLQKLPADQTIADFGTNGMVVSETRDAVANEVSAMKKYSQGVLDSVDHHQEVVTKCNQLLEELNPQIKAEAEQRREMDSLKSQMADIQDKLAQLLGTKS